MLKGDDTRWLAAAASLARRARPLSRPNPGVGAIIVKNGVVIARGWTQNGGRPHAEAMALAQIGAQAGSGAKGADLYVTLEPCAHQSERGPSCAQSVAEAGLGRVIIGMSDPDPRTSGAGIARIRDAGISVEVANWSAEKLGLEGFHSRLTLGRPHVTLKLAMTLDGAIALANGESQWITGEIARAHCHRERSNADAILVGGGTLRSDNPRLDVRLAGLEARSPQKWALTSHEVPDGWNQIAAPEDISSIEGAQYLFIEGGARCAAAFLKADLVDRLLIYRAPILAGAGLCATADLGLTTLGDAHGRWQAQSTRQLGSDRLEVYSRIRNGE